MTTEPTLSDLFPPTEIDDAFSYARSTATAIIDSTRAACIESNIEPTNPNLARYCSSDQIESASFTNLQIDPSTLCMMIELILCDRLDCDYDHLSADY
jgi:hypothetical protein